MSPRLSWIMADGGMWNRSRSIDVTVQWLNTVRAWSVLRWGRRSSPSNRGDGATDTTLKSSATVAIKPTAPYEMLPIWHAMLGGLLDPAVLLDRARLVLALNPAAKATLAADECLGRHISQISRSPELLAAIDRSFSTNEPQGFQIRILVPVERSFTGRVTPLPRSIGFENSPALLLVLRDLTEQDKLTRLRADFVANASHELRTPLASLKGYVETLQGAAKDDPVARAKFLPIMLAQANRMSRLIEDLLSLSRIEMREHVPPRDSVDLSGLVTEVAGMCRPLAEAAGYSLVVAPLPADAVVVGDRDELLQVAHNLVQNAIKYGKPGGRIDVAIRDVGNRLSLSVTDDGIGIAPQHLPRLTERFYRVSAKDSRERGGTGLGLAIVKHIVNRHRGDVRIISVPGQGSEFTVLLPRA
jgi:two-component system, OmpR family, phosphate regulon sensor histidine kinase PhoR